MVWCNLVLKGGIVTRDNYSYIKNQKELANKKKKEERRQIKLAKKNASIQNDLEQVTDKDIPVV